MVEVRRTIGDTWGWPRVQLQPSVRSHQECAYRWAIHRAVGLAIQPVVIPADSLLSDVKDRFGTEVHVARLTLARGRGSVDPGPDHQALGAPGRLSPGVGLQPLEHPQCPAQKEVEPSANV